MDKKDVLATLKAACDKAGSQNAWAKQNEVSVQYVADVLAGRRDPGAKVLDALGLEKAPVRYRRRVKGKSGE